MEHPLYEDEVLVESVTREHLDAGRTVFQLWMTRPTEQEHSVQVLDMVAPPHRAHVLSLGCGIAGMEAHWQDERPDMRFTLVNQSAVQLDLAQCSGHSVTRHCCDLMAYQPPAGRRFDVVILAYVLGHVNAVDALAHAKACCGQGGMVLVLDVFDASSGFIRTLQYDAPDSHVMTFAGFKRANVPGWHMSPFIAEDARALGVISQAMPAMWTYHA